MKRIPNPEMDRIILNSLADKYKIYQPRSGIHLSTLVYCLTKGFFDLMQAVNPTDEEVMLFCLGFGLQDVLTPKQATTPVFEKDGITFSPDFMFPVGEKYVEIKTTRTSAKKAAESLPETWVVYIKGGCFIRGVTTYELSVLYMLGNYAPPFPKILSETLVFEQAELEANWKYITERKAILDKALVDKVSPVPFTYCYEWECKNCRYKMQCQAIQMVAQAKEAK